MKISKFSLNTFLILFFVAVSCFDSYAFELTKEQSEEIDRQLKKTFEQQERFDKILTNWESLQAKAEAQSAKREQMLEAAKLQQSEYAEQQKKNQENYEKQNQKWQEMLSAQAKQTENYNKSLADYQKHMDEYKKRVKEYEERNN